mmetsp:Transcript_65898/g.155667  ORF Transcript_65898/g.155667 Transcript_65898/m.155667 type:complete len:109 (-) Transcript_65898:69-395(-)
MVRSSLPLARCAPFACCRFATRSLFAHKAQAGVVPAGDEEDELGSDLDDEESVPEPDNLILTQFEKVSRTKTNWKCTLKDGIAHLVSRDGHGRDFIFKKANGQFDWVA